MKPWLGARLWPVREDEGQRVGSHAGTVAAAVEKWQTILGVSPGFQALLTDGLLNLPTVPKWGLPPMGAVTQTAEDMEFLLVDLEAGCEAVVYSEVEEACLFHPCRGEGLDSALVIGKIGVYSVAGKGGGLQGPLGGELLHSVEVLEERGGKDVKYGGVCGRAAPGEETYLLQRQGWVLPRESASLYVVLLPLSVLGEDVPLLGLAI